MKSTKFFAFLESLKTPSNRSLIESVKRGYMLLESNGRDLEGEAHNWVDNLDPDDFRTLVNDGLSTYIRERNDDYPISMGNEFITAVNDIVNRIKTNSDTQEEEHDGGYDFDVNRMNEEDQDIGNQLDP